MSDDRTLGLDAVVFGRKVAFSFVGDRLMTTDVSLDARQLGDVYGARANVGFVALASGHSQQSHLGPFG